MKNWLNMLMLGVTLKCPNCGRGSIMRNFFELKEICPSCQVRFERQPGEGTGAMMILLSTLPLIVILLFFIVQLLGFEIPLIPLTIGLAVLLTLLMLALYRHARGVWLGVIAAGSGLYTDEEYAARRRQKG